MGKKVATTVAFVVLGVGAAVRADVLLLDGIEVASQSATERPKAGMNMSKVEATYGSPSEKHGAVGQPPITRWDYPAFSVYFENELVIHAVAHH